MTDREPAPFVPTARLLLHVFRAFEEDLLRRLAEAGHGDVTASHVNLLRHLDPGGLRMSALAKDAGLSKQAVSQLVRPLIARDLVALVPDPDDRRAKRVVWTEYGREVLHASIAAVGGIELAYIEALGERRYGELRESLERMLSLHGE